MSPPPIEGYVAQRWLSDGVTLVAVAPMTFGRGRLVIGDRYGVDDAWCYETIALALAAFVTWDPDLAEEPKGWIRHPTTGRRRPDGDATREYVHA